MSVKVKNIFMNEVAPPNDDQGVMNIGKHCHQCRELDFLPFACEFCNRTFCSKHRNLELHHCVGRPQKEALPGKQTGPTAKSLFPDSDARRAELEKSLKAASPDAAVAKKTMDLKTKLTKLLHLEKLRRETKKLIFSKSSPKVNKTAELLKLKKAAKGPASIPAPDKFHIWVVNVDRNEQDLDQIHVDRDRVAVYVSKKWLVGRVLDLVADTLGTVNKNNSTTSEALRLGLFRVDNDIPSVLENMKKIAAVVAEGDTVYLVKGAM